MKTSPILRTDSYKPSHWPQYPEGTTKVFSYLESRGGIWNATLFYGLQPILQKYLVEKVTMEMIDQAELFLQKHLGNGHIFNRSGWEYIVKQHGGRLPVEIKAVKEGSLVPTGNVLMTIENTDDKCFWLTNYIETVLMKVWAPITIATNSHYAKKLIEEFAVKTGSPLENVQYKLHDFGYRGVSSEETAAILGSAHLVSFSGSDTIAGILFIIDHYMWNIENGLPGHSVPASEHSTATPYGRGDGEKTYVMNMLDKYPEGVVSCIADSYDVDAFTNLVSTDKDIKEKILSRKGVFVLRLDSGDPTAGVLKALQTLWDNIGGTYTNTGYKLLNPKIRVLQGDGIDYATIKNILSVMENNKYASDNIVFGSGGGLLQKFNRDTMNFAIKCSFAIVNGKEVNVQKEPKSGGKKSKRGRLKLHCSGGSYSTISSADHDAANFNSYIDDLQVVYRNGELYNQQTFSEIRARAKQY